MKKPRIVITGSSGFIGRHLLEILKERYEIYGLARRSQARCGAPFHKNIHWHQVDIGERQTLERVFKQIQEKGPIEAVVHLAAHYDFTGEKHPEYERTNVHGLRNVLDACRRLGPRQFIFSSSVAACPFPDRGNVIDERTPPTGDHIYAQTKRIGEEMLAEYRDSFPSVIVRFAALFSDWCEYPPMFMFLQTWLSKAWNKRLLGGKGRSAIPYLHVRDAVGFLDLVLDRAGELEPEEILIASTDGAVSHEQLFLAATHYYYGDMRRPLYTPKPLVLPGIAVRCLLGRLFREMPFERPWMARYVDKGLSIDASRTRARLEWSPRPRLEILRRLPFLIENLKIDPVEWNRCNRAAMKQVRVRPNLKIHALLGKHEKHLSEVYTDALTHNAESGRFESYRSVETEEHHWNHRLILRNLMNAVRTRERGVFLSYCQDLAMRRMAQGFSSEELCGALMELDRICLETLYADPEAEEVRPYLHDHITTNIRFGCDHVQETFDRAAADRAREARPEPSR